MQPLHLPIGDQCLTYGALSLEDVDEVEDDAAFHSQVDVEVAQADVEVDDAGGMASLG